MALIDEQLKGYYALRQKIGYEVEPALTDVLDGYGLYCEKFDDCGNCVDGDEDGRAWSCRHQQLLLDLLKAVGSSVKTSQA